MRACLLSALILLEAGCRRQVTSSPMPLSSDAGSTAVLAVPPLATPDSDAGVAAVASNGSATADDQGAGMNWMQMLDKEGVVDANEAERTKRFPSWDLPAHRVLKPHVWQPWRFAVATWAASGRVSFFGLQALNWQSLALVSMKEFDLQRPAPAEVMNRPHDESDPYFLRLKASRIVTYEAPLPPSLAGGHFYFVSRSGVREISAPRLLGKIALYADGFGHEVPGRRLHLGVIDGGVPDLPPGDCTGYVARADAPVKLTVEPLKTGPGGEVTLRGGEVMYRRGDDVRRGHVLLGRNSELRSALLVAVQGDELATYLVIAVSTPDASGRECDHRVAVLRVLNYLVAEQNRWFDERDETKMDEASAEAARDSLVRLGFSHESRQWIPGPEFVDWRALAARHMPAADPHRPLPSELRTQAGLAPPGEKREVTEAPEDRLRGELTFPIPREEVPGQAILLGANGARAIDVDIQGVVAVNTDEEGYESEPWMYFGRVRPRAPGPEANGFILWRTEPLAGRPVLPKSAVVSVRGSILSLELDGKTLTARLDVKLIKGASRLYAIGGRRLLHIETEHPCGGRARFLFGVGESLRKIDEAADGCG